MTLLIKKYKNRRLYDTEKSAYITVETLRDYVLAQVDFKVIDAASEKDLTNATLLQIIVEMEGGPSQFLSTAILKQIISLAHHPMQKTFQKMMEDMFVMMEKPLKFNPYQQMTENWNKQMKEAMQQWQEMFKNK